MSSATLAAALGVAGAALGPALAALAARRAAQQPVAYSAAAEDLLVDLAETDDAARAVLVRRGVRADWFLHPARQRRWQELTATGAAGENPEVLGGSADGGEAGSPDRLPPEAARAADEVAWLHDDRASFPGRLAVQVEDREPPGRRVPQQPTLLRLVVAALLCGAGGAAAGWLADGSWVVGALALGVVACGYLYAAIDHDVLTVDLGVFWVGSAALWVGVVVAAAAGAIPWGWALGGVAAVVGWGVVLEAANLVYRALRGVDGIGFGDAMIGVVTVGVPTAFTGSWVVGVYSVVAGMTLAVLVSIPLMAVGKRGRQEAFAFGPYLAVGWLAAWAVAGTVG
jgi:prepilin signal peptidase PulO-like enzyme (type II secretory pathway)